MKIFQQEISTPVFAIFKQVGTKTTIFDQLNRARPKMIPISVNKNITTTNLLTTVKKAAQDHREELLNDKGNNYHITEFYTDGKIIKIPDVYIPYSHLIHPSEQDLCEMKRTQLIKFAKNIPLISESSKFPGRYQYTKVSKKTNAEIISEIRAHYALVAQGKR